MKYKDPGCPTISIAIEDQLIHRALLDSGANVNLTLFTKYERLELGELKPIEMVIQLVDRSIRLPRGIIENVTKTKKVSNIVSQVPIILRRPFLDTSNALINYRNSMIRLSFGNMTLELDILNMQR